MTVAKLIEKLQKMKPDAVVMTGDGERWGEGFCVKLSVSDEGRRVVIREEG